MTNLTKKYRAKNGVAQFEIFAERDGVLYGRVYCPDGKGYWMQWTWKSDGTNSHGACFDIEEIPVTPEHGLKVDDLVWVWNAGQTKENGCLRYFSRYGEKQGVILCWENGATSLTAKCRDASWVCWEKYQPEPVQVAEPATPKWHKYLNQGYHVFCKVWNSFDEKPKSFNIVFAINADDLYMTFRNDWQHAEPIPTECGKFCTGIKNGKTFLLPLE